MTAKHPTLLATALLAAALALTGCGSGGDSGKAAQSDRNAAAPEAADREAGSVQQQDTAEAEDTTEAPVPAPTHIIRTASLTVTTDDVSGALAEARTTVESAGGYVADETTDRDADGNERSRLTLRVPPQEYDAVLDDLAGLGKPVERKVSAKDVTDQVVDVESRIRTQRASVSRIRELMDQATDLSDVVSLESELSDRQADLEALQARLESLESRTGMATVTLALHEPDAKPAPENDETTIGDALAGGWNAFTATLRWIVIVLGAALPFAATALLLWLLWRTVRHRLPSTPRLRTRPAPPAPVTPPPPVGDTE
ncbi:DUF4349 domain-containing protein [Streptomyces sp. TRM 70361]|uniref:DUF4349 domain-containing protein n=1 Tax=Streptomyces sp. TRM 70361 TaxID=3116553 RepID=UPI002E7B390F|nr:DUF4349 domain-containing protein [Streptomyces sp. TRM 70361]MEE1941132.1 DUF4349 domain-containing protein [Streptomyces sp. TRM 70361]